MSADTDPPDDSGDTAEVEQLKDEVRQLKHEYAALAETLREDRPSDEEVIELVDKRVSEKASSSTRRNVLQALGIGGAATLLGGTAGAATSSSATQASFAVGDVTANTYKITGNKYGGPDGAQSELESELDSDDAGAKFVAQDTGAKYHWTGSAWNKMPVTTPSVNTEAQAGSHSVLISSASKLESIDAELSQGDVALVEQPDTPYRTSSWIDIDTSDVAVTFESNRAANGDPIVKVADNANVGGVRIGHNSAVSNVTLRNYGHDGNKVNQDQTVLRLHGVIVEDADTVTVENCYLTRTSPYHKHDDGGSGITIRHQARRVLVVNNRIDDIGDRGIQCSGQQVTIAFNKDTNGYDRGIALNVVEPGPTSYIARSVSVVGNVGRTHTQGSFIGVSDSAQRSNRGNFAIVGNSVRGEHGSLVTCTANAVDEVAIVGNAGHDTGSSNDQSGVNISTGAGTNEGYVVVGNSLDNYTDHGVNVSGVDTTVVGNRIESPTNQGIRINGSRGFVVANTINKPGKNGIKVNKDLATVGQNWINKAGDNGIYVNGAAKTTVVGNQVRFCNVNASGSDEFHINGTKTLVSSNQVTQQNGVAAFAEGSSAANNFFTANWAPDGSSVWSLTAASTDARNNRPTYDLHRSLSPSSGSVTVTFDKPYSEKPMLDVIPEAEAIWSVSWTTNGSGEYTDATLSFVDNAGNAVNPTTHVRVEGAT